MALRYYTERLDRQAVTRTPAGMVRVDATVAKAGVYKYTRSDGSVIREYLPPEELQRADSIASLEDVTVTNRHPANMVDPSTWQGVSIGHARGAKYDNGKHTSTLVIAREDAQLGIGKDLLEVSRGVRVRVDNTPGVTPEGEHYDAVQRDIVYNHIALGPQGWGRQGSEVSLRLDSAGDELIEHTDTREQAMKITHNGKVYEFKTDSEAQAFVDGLAAPRTDGANPFAKKGEEDDDDDKKKAKEKKDAADALAAEKARADTAQAKLDAIDAANKATARTALETRSKGVLGDVKFDGKSDRDVHLSVLAKLSPTVKFDGKSDVYVEAAYDLAISAAPTSSNRSDSIAAGLHGVGAGGLQFSGSHERKDGEADPNETPRDRMIRRDNEAWKVKA